MTQTNSKIMILLLLDKSDSITTFHKLKLYLVLQLCLEEVKYKTKNYRKRFFFLSNNLYFNSNSTYPTTFFCKADLNQVILALYCTLLHFTTLYCTLLNPQHHFSPVLYMMCNTTKIEQGIISSPSHTTVRAVRHTAVQLTFNACRSR